MSKTTFDPKTKAFVGGESQEKDSSVEEQSNQTKIDTFEKITGLSWKAFTSTSSSSDLEVVSDFIFDDDTLDEAVDTGIVNGGSALSTGPQSQFDLSIKKATKDEYKEYFEAVELPPSIDEAIALFPNEADKDSLQDSIDETKLLYSDKLQELVDRKYVLENILAGGKATGEDVEIIRQQIAAIDRGVIFTKEQLSDLETYETSKIGDGSSI